ncbi:MAG: peptidoglycan-binding protein [Proteobacteria bacterium]|nr:peptidoglycan-binding protein [Pseudomonadota bacterium]
MDIKSGAKGDLVQKIQKRLIELDFIPGSIDGDFGSKTEKAVIEYQKSAKLKADGIVGPVTAEALGLGHIFHVSELERRQFKTLLSSNPNYFGNYPDSGYNSVTILSKKTKYEEITCVGFNPDTNILTATVQIKLPYGYGGNQCGDGTMEHVRFYIDYGGGAGWEDAGLGGVKVWDLPNAADCAKKPNKPLSYVVSIEIDPKKKYCLTPVLPKVRAILSWERIPPDSNPDWPPTWGNVMERDIQIKPRPWLSVIPIDVVKLEYIDILEGKLEPPELIPIDIPGPPPVEFMEVAKLYTSKEFIKKSGVKVEPHRFGHSALKMISGTSLPDPGLASVTLAEWNDLKLDFGKAIKLLDNTTADISYEELHCIGLDPNRDWLEATFTIKKSAGYSSGLCKPGSMEYVAFWADWDNTCSWTYLGTAEVNVHDLPDIPTAGLNYTAFLPVDLDKIRQHCSEPKIGRIRAVLSWNQSPSTTDPNNLRHYGNRLDTHVQIRPAAPKALIERIGGVSVAQIDYIGNGKTKVGAQMMPEGSFADYWGAGSNACPFGGTMFIVGKQFNDGKYRLKVRPAGDSSSEIIVKTKFWITKGLNPPTVITPDPVTGYVNYSDVFNNHDDMLGWWASASNNGMWEIMLERVKPDLTVVNTPWYKILLDNIEAKAEITLDGGACKTFVKGVAAEITGKFVATDNPHFAGFRLRTLPASISPPAPLTPGTVSSSSGSWTKGTTEAFSPGRVWKLIVDDMVPCGYVVEVYAYDQTIRSNHSNAHSYGRDDVGFCLLEK